MLAPGRGLHQLQGPAGHALRLWPATRVFVAAQNSRLCSSSLDPDADNFFYKEIHAEIWGQNSLECVVHQLTADPMIF